MKLNQLKPSYGPIIIDIQNTPVKGVKQIGYVKPFSIPYSTPHMGVNRTNSQINDLDYRFEWLRRSFSDFVDEVVFGERIEKSWEGRSDLSMQWHIDGHIYQRPDKWVSLILSLTPKPADFGTEFKMGDGEYCWTAKSWHLYCLPYQTYHRAAIPQWKVFLRWFVQPNQEFLNEIQN